jgi:hypothetical protein
MPAESPTEAESGFCECVDDDCECGRSGMFILGCPKPYTEKRMDEIMTGLRTKVEMVPVDEIGIC